MSGIQMASYEFRKKKRERQMREDSVENTGVGKDRIENTGWGKIVLRIKDGERLY